MGPDRAEGTLSPAGRGGDAGRRARYPATSGTTPAPHRHQPVTGPSSDRRPAPTGPSPPGNPQADGPTYRSLMAPDEHRSRSRSDRAPVPPEASEVHRAGIRAELRWAVGLLALVTALPAVGIGVLVLGPWLGTAPSVAIGAVTGLVVSVLIARLRVQRSSATAADARGG